MKETEYNNKESAGKGKASELIELNKDIRIIINSLKEYISSIINTLRALI